MLYSDISEEFKKKIKKYIQKLRDTVEYKDDRWIVNGTQIPANMKTRHQNLDIMSERLVEYMTESSI